MINENNTNENPSLFRRTMLRFYDFKVTKSILGLTMATTMFLSGCAYPPNNIPDTTPSDSSNPPISSSQNNSNETDNQNNYEYSQILLNVLNNQHYNSLIERARAGNKELYERGEFKPHPYAFLEDEGFDVEAIKNNSLDCYTMSYELDNEPNMLYIYTRVNDGSVVHNYLLKYKLTEQEMDDYDMLHDDPSTATNYFIQSVFMNNEISQTRDPISIEESKMTVEAFDGMTETMCKSNWNETKNSDIIMINPNPKEFAFELITLPRYYETDTMTHSSYLTYLLCSADVVLNNGVYTNPYTYGIFKPKERNKLNAKLYFSQNAELNIVSCKNLEK